MRGGGAPAVCLPPARARGAGLRPGPAVAVWAPSGARPPLATPPRGKPRGGGGRRRVTGAGRGRGHGVGVWGGGNPPPPRGKNPRKINGRRAPAASGKGGGHHEALRRDGNGSGRRGMEQRRTASLLVQLSGRAFPGVFRSCRELRAGFHSDVRNSRAWLHSSPLELGPAAQAESTYTVLCSPICRAGAKRKWS